MASLKDHLARHPCMELREEGDRFIFYCVLCEVTCDTPSHLSDHLKNESHIRDFNRAKLLLLGPNPWPFNDGRLFLGGKNLGVTESFYGLGQINASFVGIKKDISKIWWEWLGEKDADENIEIHDFGVRTFNFHYDLGLPATRLHSEPESKRVCYLCHREMLPGKSVATLVNMRTEKRCCKNGGGFHVFHLSCLVHWILLCECEILDTKYGIKCASKWNAREDVDLNKICSVFCPECQGNGVEGHEPSFSDPQILRCRMKEYYARQAWMESQESQENLENCSIGLYFPSKTKRFAKVEPLKQMPFYFK